MSDDESSSSSSSSSKSAVPSPAGQQKDNDDGEMDSSSSSSSVEEESAEEEEKPAESAQEQPAESAQEQPADRPQEKPAESAQEQPAESAQEQPADRPQEKPAESAQEQPAESAQEQPADRPQEPVPEYTKMPGYAAAMAAAERAQQREAAEKAARSAQGAPASSPSPTAEAEGAAPRRPRLLRAHPSGDGRMVPVAPASSTASRGEALPPDSDEEPRQARYKLGSRKRKLKRLAHVDSDGEGGEEERDPYEVAPVAPRPSGERAKDMDATEPCSPPKGTAPAGKRIKFVGSRAATDPSSSSAGATAAAAPAPAPAPDPVAPPKKAVISPAASPLPCASGGAVGGGHAARAAMKPKTLTSRAPGKEGLFELSLQALQGRWRHSRGLGFFTVTGDLAVFDGGLKLKVVEHKDGRLEVVGWFACPEQSTSEEIVWSNHKETCSWHFEDEGELAELAEPMELEVNPANIIQGKRQRKKVDYKALNAQLDAEERAAAVVTQDSGDEESEEPDEERQAKAPRRSISTGAEKKSKGHQPVMLSEAGCKVASLDTLQKLLASTPPVDRALGLLRVLSEKEVVASDLARTKIGVTVNKMKTQYAEAAVKAAAHELVLKWKNLWQRQKALAAA